MATITSLVSNLLYSVLLMLFGVLIGASCERLASLNAFLIPNKVWNTVVKIVVALSVWIYFIKNAVFNNDAECRFPVTSNFFRLFSSVQSTGDINDEKCTSTLACTIIMELLLKTTCLYLSTKFGASLQPVGLTGGIACGKSTVSKLLFQPSNSQSKDAFAIVDVDEIAHDILVPGKYSKHDCAYHRIVSTFQNDDVLMESNEIDRRKLGDVIFRDASKRRMLNRITHPLISKVMLKQVIREHFFPLMHNTSTVAVDIPLLFEVGLKMKVLFAIKVVIACTSELQLLRLKERNPDLTLEQCQKRIESQMPVYKKVEMADIVIWNNGTMDDLIQEVEVARREINCRKHAYFGISAHGSIACMSLLTACAFSYDIIQLMA